MAVLKKIPAGPRHPAPRWRVEYRAPDGSHRSETFRLKKDAERFLHDTESAMRGRRWRDPDAGSETLNAHLDAWLGGQLGVRPLRETTRVTYATLANLYIRPALGMRELRSIRRSDVAVLIAGLRRSNGAPAGAPTREKVYVILRRALAVAMLRDDPPWEANPASSITVSVRPEPVRKARFLSADEVDRLADSIGRVEHVEEPERYRALVLVAAWCGPRIGELSALRVRHLDMLRRRIRIEEAAAYVSGRRHEGLTKTGKARTVPVPRAVWEPLERHLERFVDTADPDAYVFAGPDGAPLRPGDFRRRVYNRATALAEIEPRPTVHDLRHTAASLMAANGYSITEAGAILGHASGYMTSRYTHLFPERLDALAERLDAAIVAAREAGGR